MPRTLCDLGSIATLKIYVRTMANPASALFITPAILPLCTGDTNDEETNLDCLDVCGILNGFRPIKDPQATTRKVPELAPRARVNRLLRVLTRAPTRAPARVVSRDQQHHQGVQARARQILRVQVQAAILRPATPVPPTRVRVHHRARIPRLTSTVAAQPPAARLRDSQPNSYEEVDRIRITSSSSSLSFENLPH